MNRFVGELKVDPSLEFQRKRILRSAWAFVTQRVERHDAACLLPLGTGRPIVGDLVLARVNVIGHHTRLHLINGRKQLLFVGDEVVVVYGNRYASSQFEAVVPQTFGPCHLVASGGMASRALSWHDRLIKGPTHITPLGLVGDIHGTPLNLKRYALEERAVTRSAKVIAILGTSMDAGKTQTACYFARGLILAGLKVGFVKVTGTGAADDMGWLEDAGLIRFMTLPTVDFHQPICRVVKSLNKHWQRYVRIRVIVMSRW
ncbi:MAG: DUF1611 domain-containing protein [Pseudomonadales bacterium]|nr:DUF1611 domain-containing protein [Pseudomonadales bacterium]